MLFSKGYYVCVVTIRLFLWGLSCKSVTLCNNYELDLEFNKIVVFLGFFVALLRSSIDMYLWEWDISVQYWKLETFSGEIFCEMVLPPSSEKVEVLSVVRAQPTFLIGSLRFFVYSVVFEPHLWKFTPVEVFSRESHPRLFPDIFFSWNNIIHKAHDVKIYEK